MPAPSHAGPAGVLVVAHGTRDQLGLQQTRSVAEQLAQRLPHALVELCFLELAEPNIAAGLRRCVERGAGRLTVLPLLLFAAGHAKRDIPLAVAEAARNWPGLEVRQTPPLGCHPRLLELSALRFNEAVANGQAAADDETLLLMVGRGSIDPEANAEMARFSRMRFEQRPLGWIETCYAAMTRPSLQDALHFVAGLRFANLTRIVVQPHLLFSGELANGIRNDVQRAAGRERGRQWLLTEPLGPHPLLVEALADQVESVG